MTQLKHVDPGLVMTQAEFIATAGHALNGQAAGDLIYAASASQLQGLHIGAANTILSPSSGLPAWLTAVQAFTGAGIALTARDSTNSMISYIGELNGANFDDGESCTFTIPAAVFFSVNNNTNNQAGLFFTDGGSGAVVELADPSSVFEVTDTGAAFRIFKSSSGIVTIKNSIGSSKTLAALVVGKVSSATGIA